MNLFTDIKNDRKPLGGQEVVTSIKIIIMPRIGIQ
jgi:hypothetical protein